MQFPQALSISSRAVLQRRTISIPPERRNKSAYQIVVRAGLQSLSMQPTPAACSPRLKSRTRPIAAPAAMLPTTTICTPEKQHIRILLPPPKPITAPSFTYPKPNNATTITPIEIYNPRYTCSSPMQKYGISGRRPPKKYATAIVIAEVRAREDAGSSSQWWNFITKSTRFGVLLRWVTRSFSVCLGTL